MQELQVNCNAAINIYSAYSTYGIAALQVLTAPAIKIPMAGWKIVGQAASHKSSTTCTRRDASASVGRRNSHRCAAAVLSCRRSAASSCTQTCDARQADSPWRRKPILRPHPAPSPAAIGTRKRSLRLEPAASNTEGQCARRCPFSRHRSRGHGASLGQNRTWTLEWSSAL